MRKESVSKFIMLSACAIFACAMLFTSCENATDASSTVKKTYYVTLYNRGSATDPSQFKDGDAYTLPTPTRKFYTFKGWNSAKNGSGTSYAAGDSITVSSTIELYGQWALTNGTITMTDDEYAAFCKDRNSLDSDLNLTIKISDTLPSADDLSTSSYNLSINLDLSSCTSLKNLDDTYSLKKLVGIVFPKEIESISRFSFNYPESLVSVKFSDTTGKTWYNYASGSWDTATRTPTSSSLKSTVFSQTDDASNATVFKSGYYWSTQAYVAK